MKRSNILETKVGGIVMSAFLIAYRKLARNDKNRWKNGCVMCRCDCYLDCGLAKEKPKK